MLILIPGPKIPEDYVPAHWGPSSKDQWGSKKNSEVFVQLHSIQL